MAKTVSEKFAIRIREYYIMQYVSSRCMKDTVKIISRVQIHVYISSTQHLYSNNLRILQKLYFVHQNV